MINKEQVHQIISATHLVVKDMPACVDVDLQEMPNECGQILLNIIQHEIKMLMTLSGF